jgi:hypothetical protein
MITCAKIFFFPLRIIGLLLQVAIVVNTRQTPPSVNRSAWRDVT